MRTITLSKELVQDIHATCEHYINDTDGQLTQDYEELRDITQCDNIRFKVTVTIEERIPSCADLIVNILVKHILELVDCNKDDTEEMNALYQYLENAWGFNPNNQPYLLKATTLEALEYCVRWLIPVMGSDL